jgi:hypothetical protein
VTDKILTGEQTSEWISWILFKFHQIPSNLYGFRSNPSILQNDPKCPDCKVLFQVIISVLRSDIDCCNSPTLTLIETVLNTLVASEDLISDLRIEMSPINILVGISINIEVDPSIFHGIETLQN